MDEGARRTSSYLRMAASDPTKVAQRKLMIECFLSDVSRPLPPLPPKPDGAVRLLSWNLNILCGPDWDTPVSAADVAEVIRELDADILALEHSINGICLVRVQRPLLQRAQ